jgi:hypothetical protein
MLRTFRTSLLAIAALVAPLALAAQTPAEILERYNRTIDAEGKLATHEGMKWTANVSIAAVGMTMTMVMHAQRPDLVFAQTDMPGMGVSKQGYDGSTAWSSDPMQGPRLLAGLEAAAISENSGMRSNLRTPDLYTSLTEAGEMEVDGDKAKCVTIAFRSGRIATECFSIATGLMVEARSTQQSPQGEIQVTTRPSDYRNVGGVLLAHRQVQQAMGMEIVVTLTAIEFGPQPAALFELPAEVKALKPAP